VAVALPYLDCFLNINGTALAEVGAPLPVRFGTWFWGLGVNPNRFFPTKTGKGYDLLPELSPIAKFQDKVTVFSGFDCLTDGKPIIPHGTGSATFRSGTAPGAGGALPGATFDNIVADAISAGTRFRTLDVSAIGDSRNSLSGQGAGQMNPVETNAMRFYQRIFGDGFVDPNSATFSPDPRVMAHKSVLSVVNEERKALERALGPADRARLDQYFTAVRQTEEQLAIQLRKPDPLIACKVPPPPDEKEVQTVLEDVIANHEMMARLLAMALACNQTRVFNVAFTNGASSLTRKGSSTTHHQLTHDEVVDPKLGYQPEATKFVESLMGAWGTFLGILDGMPEGDGTLLDHMLVVAHSETEYAKNHTVTNLPVMFAGGANGRIRTGMHVQAKREPVSRVALTAMQAVGVQVESFGTMSMQTKKPISELLV
jgi:hypothetical protein